jgi:hypothetical protein
VTNEPSSGLLAACKKTKANLVSTKKRKDALSAKEMRNKGQAEGAGRRGGRL